MNVEFLFFMISAFLSGILGGLTVVYFYALHYISKKMSHAGSVVDKMIKDKERYLN